MLSFRGLAGGIFITLVVAAIIYVIGFATVAWSIRGKTSYGLWQECTCNGIKEDARMSADLTRCEQRLVKTEQWTKNSVP